MEHATSLAKLTRPRLYHALPRERLFRRLDEARERQAVWIASPPGAGKTTLVSSYLDSRKLPALWYQMDSGNADPASFFYYLASAAEVLAPGERLELLAPEYLADLSGYTRRFFRELFRRLPQPCVVIFDNYHTVAATSVLHEVVRAAIEEVPEGVCIIATSRFEPPAVLLRQVLSRAMLCIGWDELRVSLEEARQIAVLEGKEAEGSDENTQAIWEAAGGWAAGLVLMLAHRRATGGTGGAGALPSRETLFNYFAVEIFAAASSDTRHLLLRTAFLPNITVAMAQAISGDLDAGKRLEELYRLRYFIDRRDEPEPIYHYHALFREFLIARVREQMEPAECLLLQRRSARLLDAADYGEDAFPLLVSTEDWPAAAALIRQHAARLIEQGRGQTVKAWIEALPAATLEAEPWVLYWQGAAEVFVHPRRARDGLEKAYAALAGCGDTFGQITAASAILETYYFEWTMFTPLDRWIEALGGLLADEAAFPSAAVELHARSSFLAALLYRQPQHPLLAREAARTLALLEGQVQLCDRFPAATILLNCYCFQGDFNGAERVVGMLRARLDDREISPLNQVWWRIALAYYRLLRADREAAAGALEEAEGLVATYGLGFIESAVLTQKLLLALSFGDLALAGTLLPRLQSTVDPVRRLDVSLFHSARSWFEAQQGDLAAALTHAETAIETAFECGAVSIQTYFVIARAQLLIATGDCERAQSSVRGVRMRASGASRLLEFDTMLTEAYAALQMGDDENGLMLLQGGLALGRRQGYVSSFRWHPLMMARLLARALEEGIEADYARQLIRMRGIRPDSSGCEEWPWPIRIYTLGSFSIAIDGATLATTGKAQAKPLELLKFIVAQGGRDAAASTVASALWPDLDGDAAQHALDTALHRLRKLLRHAEAVVVQQGKLSLDPLHAWVDIWAFERLVQRLERNEGSRAADRLFTLYRGNFLDRDSEAAWAMPLRERLRSKFLRQAANTGRELEDGECWEEAIQAYQRGIEVDNLSEELYRCLMTCHHRRGQAAAAIEVYRRCRQMLSVVMGIQPSAETQRIYQRIVEG